MFNDKLDFDRVLEAAEASCFGLDSTGFCTECGAESDGVEPDARGNKCDVCGAMAVCGAEWLLL